MDFSNWRCFGWNGKSAAVHLYQLHGGKHSGSHRRCGRLIAVSMSQAVTGATVVNDSGSFKFSNSATGLYQIGGANMLGTGIPSTPSNV